MGCYYKINNVLMVDTLLEMQHFILTGFSVFRVFMPTGTKKPNNLLYNPQRSIGNFAYPRLMLGKLPNWTMSV